MGQHKSDADFALSRGKTPVRGERATKAKGIVMSNRKVIVASWCAVLMGLILSISPAQAAGLPLIISTTVNYTNGTLTINGQNFGSSASVTLDSMMFPTMSSSSSQVVANFPSGTPPSSFTPGTYFLTIQFKNQLPTIFTVDIGANGAQGPTGAQGPAGAPGAAGAAGPAGPTGAAGPMGPPGLQGPVGPVGATGAQGAQGNTGPQGSAGPQGVAGSQGPVGPSGTSVFNGMQEFTTTGTFTIPVGITSIEVQLWGAGGGTGGAGGNGNTQTTACNFFGACATTTQFASGSIGGGGGSGGYTRAIVPVTPGSTYSVVVGRAGDNGVAGNNSNDTICGNSSTNNTCTDPGSNGQNAFSGGNTQFIDSFNSVLVAAQGGAGGSAGQGFGSSISVTPNSPAGAGGIAAGGTQTTNIIGANSPTTGFPPSGLGQPAAGGYALLVW
jgi:hypothetical protein